MTSDGIQKQFSRKDLAEALNISEQKIDVFEGMGLISERSGPGQAKFYNSFDHARLRLILRCEAAGYALDEIREMLGKVNSSTRPAQQIQASLAHAQQRLDQIEQRISQGGLLETVNLRCDQDLLQGYISEIKAIRLDLAPEPKAVAEARIPKKFTLSAAPPAPAPPPAAVDRPAPGLRTGELVRHSKSSASNLRAWKQTAATFLILCLLTGAGYVYYNFKSKLQTDGPVVRQEEPSVKPEPPEPRADNLRPQEPRKDIQPPPSPSEPRTEATGTPNIVTPPPEQRAETVKAKEPRKEILPPVEPPSAERGASTSLPQNAVKDLNRLLAEKQPPQLEKPAKKTAARPQIAAYEFKTFYEREKKILRVKFKMASIVSEGEINQGRAFVVFKPRQSSAAEGWLCIPSAQLGSGVPTEPDRGAAFSFSVSKVQYLIGFFAGDPRQFDIATVYIFSNTNELILRKEFAVDIVAY